MTITARLFIVSLLLPGALLSGTATSASSLPGEPATDVRVTMAGSPLGMAWGFLYGYRGLAAPASREACADNKQLEGYWVELEKGEVEASRAVLELYDRAKEAVPFLKLKLKALKITSGQAKALLFKLNSGDRHLWKTAFEELEYLDPRLAIGLPEMMERVTESPGRQRLVEVLSEREPSSLAGKEINLVPVGEGFNFFGAARVRGGPSQRSRISITTAGAHSKGSGPGPSAIVLLEHIGTPEAVAILKDMAAGHPDAVPTKRTKRPWSNRPETTRNWKTAGLTWKKGKARLHVRCCTSTSTRRKPSRFSRTS